MARRTAAASVVVALVVPVAAFALQLPARPAAPLRLPSRLATTRLASTPSPIGDDSLSPGGVWTPRAAAGGETGEMYEGARIGPPPDLASLLLHNRIVYLGMPMVPAVTELIVAELLYLNYESATKPVTLYINSPGTINAEGRAVGFETEAFAIADTMKYIKPPVHTVCVGQAFGAAAMLLSQGAKGNASIMLKQPVSMARGQASDIAIKAREVMANRKVACELIARACGKSVEEVMKDASRTMYLQPEEAVEYGLIDRVLTTVPKESAAVVGTARPSFMDALSA